MMKKLLKADFDFVKSKYVSKLNRFVLKVNIKNRNRLVYMPNPGRLSTILTPGREILLKKKSTGKYRHEVYAANMGSFYATLDPKLANKIFKISLEKGYLPYLRNYKIKNKETNIKGYGRIDFIISNGKENFVEIKSCTHVENGIAKFPDRPTERGRRHLKHLINFKKNKKPSHLLIVVQRPDVKVFKPFKKIDPNFYDLFEKAVKIGLGIHIISTKFKPRNKTLHLVNSDVPYKID